MDHEQMEEIKRYFGVVAEGLERKIQQVAEGVVNLNEKLDREMTALRQEMRSEFGEVKSMSHDIYRCPRTVCVLIPS
jgi:alcohol dehydrogenase class IV